LYIPYQKALKAQKINKPVILAEFGSLAETTNQTEWLSQAIESISEKYPEIKHLVFFNSAIDKNVPRQLNTSILNWQIKDYDRLRRTIWTTEIQDENCVAMDSTSIAITQHSTLDQEIAK